MIRIRISRGPPVVSSNSIEKNSSFSQVDDVCNNALDSSEGILIIDDVWEVGTLCKWLLPIEDENSYITLEFEHLDVRTLK